MESTKNLKKSLEIFHISEEEFDIDLNYIDNNIKF